MPQWLCRYQLAAFGRSKEGFGATVALSVPTRGLRPLEWWLCQCRLAAFSRSKRGFGATVALSVRTLPFDHGIKGHIFSGTRISYVVASKEHGHVQSNRQLTGVVVSASNIH
ncbi:hypothetical protein Ddc_13429 [Ditylenchus destructor]|nr:hypothetical protein Ddc_13429 [Ditylenchus destructor]